VARFLLVAGAIALAAAVALGAVAAHAVRNPAHPEAARLLQTAVLYQLVHGLGILVAGVLARGSASRLLAASGVLLLAGVILFCGSLYVLAFTGLSLGIVAPAGGLAFIAGWIALAAFALLERR